MSYMYVEDINKYLKEEKIEDLLDMCREIYHWHYITGVLPENSKLQRLGEKMEYSNYAHISEVLLIYVNAKISPIVSLLLSEFPNYYLRSFKDVLEEDT